jgi:hypothetical protein
MDKNAVPVVVVVRIAAGVRAPVDQKHLLIQLRGYPLGQRAAGKTRANNKPVYFHSLVS